MKRRLLVLSLLCLILASFSTIGLYITGSGKLWINDGFGLVIFDTGYWQVVWTDGSRQDTNGVTTRLWIFPRFSHGTNTQSFKRYDL